MGRKYNNPPIIEAVCEFRLTTETKWDLTIPGLIYEKLQDEFPQKEQRLIQEAQMTRGPQGVQQQIRTNERMLFLTEDRKRFVQVGPHLLAVNCLEPYPTWEGFKPNIVKAFDALNKILDVKGLQRIGLRYINKVEIPSRPVELEDYFEFYPFLGKNLPQKLDTFIVGGLFPLADGRDSCKVDLTTAAPSNPDGLAFILDLDYFLAKSQAVTVNQSLSWVEEAHQKVEEIFEGCINDRLRDIFQEER